MSIGFFNGGLKGLDLKEERAAWGGELVNGWCPASRAGRRGLGPCGQAGAGRKCWQLTQRAGRSQHPQVSLPALSPAPSRDWLLRLPTAVLGPAQLVRLVTPPSPGVFLTTKQNNLLLPTPPMAVHPSHGRPPLPWREPPPFLEERLCFPGESLGQGGSAWPSWVNGTLKLPHGQGSPSPQGWAALPGAGSVVLWLTGPLEPAGSMGGNLPNRPEEVMGGTPQGSSRGPKSPP